MSTRINSFSLQKIDEKIFLQAIDQEFDTKDCLNQNSQENPDDFCDVNVKFLLSLDAEEDFNDISTDGNSEVEETLKDFALPSHFKIKECLNLAEANDATSAIQRQCEKIRGDTVQSFFLWQFQMQNKMMMMKQYYSHMYSLNSVNKVQNTSSLGTAASLTDSPNKFMPNN